MTRYTLSSSATLFHADCRDAIKALPDNSIDSVVTDPPYALVSIVKRFGKPGSAPAKGNDAYMRASSGFMSCSWDTGETAFSTEFWTEVLRVLKPGGHVGAFGASRGYHRMACAIEDAGFEIRDSLINILDPSDPIIAFMETLNEAQLGAFMRCIDDSQIGGLAAWVYGQGFPKGQNVSAFIDKELGAERTEIVGVSNRCTGPSQAGENGIGTFKETNWQDSNKILAPVTPQAKEFEGFSTALKPAFEPIVLARKPLSEGTVAANVLRWRTGALNIGASRVGTEITGWGGGAAGGNTWNETNNGLGKAGAPRPVVGRWPANVVHDGSDEVVGAFPSVKARGNQGNSTSKHDSNIVFGKYNAIDCGESYNHEAAGTVGSAARFFYSAKASKQDRNGSKHPTVKPIALMEWLATLITPPGGTILDPFAGSGTTGIAATRRGFRCVLVEREAEYVADIRRRFETRPVRPALSLNATAWEAELAAAEAIRALRLRWGGVRA